MVSTEVFEGFPDAGSVNTMTLDEVDGVTTMTTLIQHEPQEHRDTQLASGMEGGMQVSYNRLEDVARQPHPPRPTDSRSRWEVLPEEADLCSHGQDFVGGGGAAARLDLRPCDGAGDLLPGRGTGL